MLLSGFEEKRDRLFEPAQSKSATGEQDPHTNHDQRYDNLQFVLKAAERAVAAHRAASRLECDLLLAFWANRGRRVHGLNQGFHGVCHMGWLLSCMNAAWEAAFELANAGSKRTIGSWGPDGTTRSSSTK
jgi:hypothetical protein